MHLGLGPTYASSSYTEVLRQPDGSILLAGNTEAVMGKYNEAASFVQRRRADGTPDPGFSEVVLHSGIVGLALQPDGKVLFGLPRSDSCASTSTIHRLEVESLIVRRDGGALVVGRIAKQDPMALFELTPAGRPDHRFGHGGLVRVGWGKSVKAGVHSAAFDHRGRVVLFGYEGHYAAMARLLPNGRLDPSYAKGGRQPYMPGLYDEISSVSIAPGGRIYVAASPETSPFPGVTTLIRFRGDGIRDRSFGRSGVVLGDPAKGSAFRPVAAARQSNGRIVVTGTRGSIDQSGAMPELLRFR